MPFLKLATYLPATGLKVNLTLLRKLWFLGLTVHTGFSQSGPISNDRRWRQARAVCDVRSLQHLLWYMSWSLVWIKLLSPNTLMSKVFRSPLVALSGSAFSCIKQSNVKDSPNRLVCLELFTQRNICLNASWNDFLKVVSIRFAKVGFRMLWLFTPHKRHQV